MHGRGALRPVWAFVVVAVLSSGVTGPQRAAGYQSASPRIAPQQRDAPAAYA